MVANEPNPKTARSSFLKQKIRFDVIDTLQKFAKSIIIAKKSIAVQLINCVKLCYSLWGKYLKYKQNKQNKQNKKIKYTTNTQKESIFNIIVKAIFAALGIFATTYTSYICTKNLFLNSTLEHSQYWLFAFIATICLYEILKSIFLIWQEHQDRNTKLKPEAQIDKKANKKLRTLKITAIIAGLLIIVPKSVTLVTAMRNVLSEYIHNTSAVNFIIYFFICINSMIILFNCLKTFHPVKKYDFTEKDTEKQTKQQERKVHIALLLLSPIILFTTICMLIVEFQTLSVTFQATLKYKIIACIMAGIVAISTILNWVDLAYWAHMQSHNLNHAHKIKKKAAVITTVACEKQDTTSESNTANRTVATNTGKEKKRKKKILVSK